MKDEGHEIRKQDLEDLYERWHDSIDALKVDWSPKGAQESMQAFQAIMDYIHTDEIPPVQGEHPDESGLVTIRTATCRGCDTTYSRGALDRLNWKCIVCGRQIEKT